MRAEAAQSAQIGSGVVRLRGREADQNAARLRAVRAETPPGSAGAK